MLPLPENTWPGAPKGFSANARIQPHERPCTWHVEYGATTAYGSTTTPRALPGKLTAVMYELWEEGVNGWTAGLDVSQLAHITDGHDSFVRATPSGLDDNHLDGVDYVLLGPFAYIGRTPGYAARMQLGGGTPDLRGARIQMRVRGNSFVANGSNVCPWIQYDLDQDIVSPDPAVVGRPNWACTSASLNSALATGDWEDIVLTLRNSVHAWTFGSHQTGDGRTEYVYGELDAGLARVNVDAFIAMWTFVTNGNEPTGTADFDNLIFRYRNHSLCADSNGGRLVSSPRGTVPATVLTDGWRHGPGHTWQSAEAPTVPQEFVYAFKNPVSIFSVTICNDPVNPSKGVEVLVSSDGTTWKSLGTKVLPQTHASGPNFLFQHWSAISGSDYGPLHTGTVSWLKVRVLTAYGATWGLGSIEAHGTGATEETDDDWYDVNQDVNVGTGTFHYRVVTVTDGGTVYGPDQTVTVPS